MSCHIRCAYGDTLMRGSNDYDGSKCSCRRCPNYDLCGSWVTRNRTCCKVCENHLNTRVLPVDKHETIECSICLEERKGSVTLGCGHKFCINCIKYYVDVDGLVLPKCNMVYQCGCEVCTGGKYPFCDRQLLRFILEDRDKVGVFGKKLAKVQEKWRAQRCGSGFRCPLCRSGL